MGIPTILIVDDEETNIKLIKAILAPENYNLIIALSGSEALSILASNPPDLVLLDVMMSDMDGFETCRTIKQSNSTKIIPDLMVIAVNSLAMESDKDYAISAGVKAYITKPINETNLINTINKYLS